MWNRVLRAWKRWWRTRNVDACDHMFFAEFVKDNDRPVGARCALCGEYRPVSENARGLR